MRVPKIFMIACLVAVTAYGSVQSVGNSRRPARIPITLTYQADNFTTVGSAPESAIVVHAIRSDGSHAQSTRRPYFDGSVHEIRSIIDLQAGTKAVVSSATRSVTTYYFKENQTLGLRRANENIGCPMNARPIERRVMGIRVVEEVVQLTDAEGRVKGRSRSVYAPDLNCVLLERVIETRGPDGMERVASETRVVGIAVGDPASELFAVPENFVEMSPTAVNLGITLRHARYAGTSESSGTEAELEAQRALTQKSEDLYQLYRYEGPLD